MNNGINYQPQLVRRNSEPSKVPAIGIGLCDWLFQPHQTNTLLLNLLEIDAKVSHLLWPQFVSLQPEGTSTQWAPTSHKLAAYNSMYRGGVGGANSKPVNTTTKQPREIDPASIKNRFLVQVKLNIASLPT